MIGTRLSESRLLLVALAASSVLAGCASDHPVTAQPEPNYFPYSVGSTWTYAARDTLGTWEEDTLFVSVVGDTLVGQHRAAKLAFETHSSGPGSPHGPAPETFKYYGLVAFETNWVSFYTPDGHPTFQRYKLPLTEGSTWDLKDPDSEWHISYEVLAVEDVSVPAGVFHSSVPVRNVEHEVDGTDTDTEYFVSGVGLVMSRAQAFSTWALVAYHIE